MVGESYLLFAFFYERFVCRATNMDLRSHKVHPMGTTDIEDNFTTRTLS